MLSIWRFYNTEFYAIRTGSHPHPFHPGFSIALQQPNSLPEPGRNEVV
jgi:hypothetical protein